MKRKLNVYFLVDTSMSMQGEPIQAINNGTALILRNGRTEADVVETARISIIEFNDTAEVVLPMTTFTEASEPTFTAGGRTSLGKALDKLSECVRDDVQRGDKSNEISGDYKSLVFILTDGYPTDNWQAALERLDRKRFSYIVTCLATGALSKERIDEVKTNVLEKISGNPEHVIELASSSEGELSKFFELVSDSIPIAAQSVNDPVNSSDTTPLGSLPKTNSQESAFF